MILAKNYIDEKERYETTERLVREFPFIKSEIIGRSHYGRKIMSYSIGNTKEQILFCGAINATDSIITYILFNFLENLCNSIKSGDNLSEINVERFLKRRGLVIIPCINPDGVEIVGHGAVSSGRYEKFVQNMCEGDSSNWKANANGIEINSNFEIEYNKIKNKKEETQSNLLHTHSEPETRAIINLCREKNIRHAISFNCKKQEISYNFGYKTLPRAKIMANIMAKSSGYALHNTAGDNKAIGFKEWFMEEFKKPAFTVGVGEDNISYEGLYNQLEEMMILSLII